MSKPHWKTVVVRLPDGHEVVESARKLAELFLWLRGEASPGCVFLDSATGRALKQPTEVGWSLFPLDEAGKALHATKTRAGRS